MPSWIFTFISLATSFSFVTGRAAYGKRDSQPPGPIAPGTTGNCNWYQLIESETTCDSIYRGHSITEAQFLSWNPSVGSPCSLVVGNAYCVEVASELSPTATDLRMSSASTETEITTPLPTQGQMVSDCNKWYFVNNGDTCAIITSKTGATQAQLYAWNGSIDSDCSGLWANVYICIGTTSVTVAPPKSTTTTTKPTTTTMKITTTTGNGVATPTPYQPGMTKSCKKFKLVQNGDTCAAIISKYGISQAQFVAWNPAIKSDCSALWVDNWVCVEIIGMTITKTTKTTTKATTTGNGVSTPTPHQTGMTKNCKEFRQVQSGDTCASITAKYGITQAQLISWNPAIKSDCSSLWAKYYICVKPIGFKPNPTTTTKKPTTTKGNGITTPTPVQKGITKKCKSFRQVQKGDTCASIQKKSNITFKQFYSWNPAVGAECKSLWSKYYVCVAVL
ncbi:hypothetical protein TWF481_002110 [Arthrobotrys musiformis]|uniref:LysM domain-containing protein n=1 Tax=Arthrobotrys musiformis TaxID=47236 RepID=A0AAV9VUP4_9PEZI